MIRTFADAERVLAETLPGYTERVQQQELARAVEEVFNGGAVRQVLAQAGCGTGKSLATVIPAVIRATSKHERIVIATITKTLQDQYANKDLPFLEENLPIPFTWKLLKGRSNYVCVSRLAEVTSHQLANVARIREELTDPEHTGDFEYLENAVPEDKRYLLSMSSAECPGKSLCPLAKDCFAEKAKAEAKEADVVVTNAAMLMVDLKLRQVTDDTVQMLGDYDAVVIDEAHELGDVATSALSDRLTRRNIENLLTMTRNFVGEHGGTDLTDHLAELRKRIDVIWAHLESLLTDDDGRLAEKIVMTATELMSNVEPYIELVDRLKLIADEVAETQVKVGRAINEQARQRRLVSRIRSMIGTLTDLIVTPGLVRWAETEKTRRGEQIINLKWSPIEVGPFLHENLWSKVPAALVSATLAVSGDFAYMTQTLGLDAPATLDVGTPFDYDTQARLLVPSSDTPDPTRRAEWSTYVHSTTRELVTAAGGGALLLYTSTRAMKEAYTLLSPIFEMAGYTCLMQGEHGTNRELSRRFEDDTHSVLFAVKSFFTGVDFSGHTCRLVIIDKMPFPVPTDIMVAARANLMDQRAGRNVSFGKLMIPMMVLPLIQGAGRLIRSKDDRGVIAILDPRVVTKGYGKTVLGSLPQMPRIETVAEAAEMFTAWA